MREAIHRIKTLGIDDRAVAAVEFAIVLPFMLLLLIGGVELGNGFAISVKVTSTAHTIADLASQNKSINDTQMTQMLCASSYVISPYSMVSGVVTISEVSTDSKGNATISWSDSLYGTPRPVGQPMILPASLAGTPNISLILGEVTYAYTPNLGYVITGTVPLSDSYYLYPRQSVSVTRIASTGLAPCPSN
jgi:Flp pilus assembly protein TadG